MATLSKPSDGDGDPDIEIMTDLAETPQVCYAIPKSKLVKHSGFFKATFRHDFAETRSNKVTLHDDDPRMVRLVLQGISLGTLQGVKRDTSCSHSEHRQLLQLLPLLRKYDFLSLEAEAIERIIGCMGELATNIWDADSFFEEHYDLVTEIYGGTYPGKLYKALALKWKGFRLEDVQMERLIAIVEATPALSLFLTDYFCDTAIAAEKATKEFLEAAERTKESAEDAVSTAEYLVEKLQAP